MHRRERPGREIVLERAARRPFYVFHPAIRRCKVDEREAHVRGMEQFELDETIQTRVQRPDRSTRAGRIELRAQQRDEAPRYFDQHVVAAPVVLVYGGNLQVEAVGHIAQFEAVNTFNGNQPLDFV
ncbi:MAG: hypothetical protein QOI88_148 [Gammaproteobacteria bacterium]|nr:hypothetical protein [Gammaproteobacteria bacterium]